MSRLVELLLVVMVSGPIAAQQAGPNLELELPRSSDPPSFAPDRLSKLEIDGQDFTLPRDTRRTVKVEPKAGDSVKVVYTYWPNTYTKFVRTQTVQLEKGKVAKASLLTPNPDVPDQIYVIYFPTPPAVVKKMCELAKITKDDVVVDIGCGDGRMVITAVKEFGAKKGLGVDIGADRIKESEANAKKAGVADKIEFKLEDALKRTDWSHVDVVLIYLSDPLNEALRPALQKTLKPGARIVSHRFLMGDWQPDQSINIRATNNYNEEEGYVLHLWTIKGEKK